MYFCTFIKIYFLCTLYIHSLLKTKEEPRNDLRTPKLKKCVLLILPFLLPCLIPPTDDREKTERTPTQLPASKKALFLRLLPKKVVPLPKKVDSYPKTIDYFPKNFYSIPKKIYSLLRISCSSFIAFYTRQTQKMHFSAKKVHFSLHTDKF